MSERNNRRAAARQAQRAVAEQNPTYVPGRHVGPFHILPTENAAAFESLKARLLKDFAPTGEAEVLLVNTMAEARWLTERAQNLTNEAMDMTTGAIVDTKLFSHSLTQFNRHSNAFHKALNELLKAKSKKRQAQFKFEAQKLKTEELRLKNERVAMNKKVNLEDRAWQDSAFQVDLGHLKLASVAGGPKYERLRARFVARYFSSSGSTKGFLV